MVSWTKQRQLSASRNNLHFSLLTEPSSGFMQLGWLSTAVVFTNDVPFLMEGSWMTIALSCVMLAGYGQTNHERRNSVAVVHERRVVDVV